MEEFRQVALSDCHESPLSTRRHFDAAALKDLTESIASKGVLTPILARPRPAGGVEILAGARRCRAARAAGLTEVPVRIREFTDDEALEVVVTENLQRADVAPLEEAEGYRALLARPGYDVASIAAKVGKAEGYVYGRLKLCELIEPAKKALAAERITAGHALLLARLQPADQKEALAHCFEHRWHGDRRLEVPVAVRSLASWIHHNLQLDLAHAPFDAADAELVPAAGSCAACPKRSGVTPALFPDISKKDVCTDRACFQGKVSAHLTQTKARLAADGGGNVVELSTQYSYDKKKDGPLPFGRWTEIKRGQKKCAHATTGLVTAGDRDVGKVLTICAAATCADHGAPRATAASPAEKARRAKEQEQQRRDAELRRRLFRAVHEAAPGRLGRAELDELLAGYVEEMQQDSIRALVQALGLEPTKEKRSYGSGTYANWQRTLETWAKDLDDKGLAKALVILPLVPGLEGREWISDRRKGLLRKAAGRYGVDVKAIEKALAAEARERAAKKAARAKKGASKKPAAPPKAKKAKRAKKKATAA